jgi:hypothetical protein
VPIAEFLASLGTLWQFGEVRPTHQKVTSARRYWRSRPDPFEHTWEKVQQWLETEPGITAKQLQSRLIEMAPTIIQVLRSGLFSGG